MLSFLLPLASDISIETAEGSNILIDENGSFVSPEQAVDNVKNLWEKWDIVGKITSNIPKVILFVVIIVAGILLSKIISKLVMKALKKTGTDASVYLFIKRGISFVINFAFLLMALGLFINVNSFLAAMAAAGVTIALGLQNSLSQLVSGIQLLLTGQLKAGDYISVDGIEGNIIEIRFMNTLINTIDNKRVIIPNSTMTSNKIVNFSAEKLRRLDLIYSISYGEDIEKAKRAILEYTSTNELILKEPEPVVFVNSHEASSIDLLARIWCRGEDYWPVYFAMQENVKKSFDKNGIEIPFNQLDVHIVK